MSRGLDFAGGCCRLRALLVGVSTAAVVAVVAVVAAVAAVAGCASTAIPSEQGPVTSTAVARKVDSPQGKAPTAVLPTPFEQRQFDHAVNLAQQKWLASAALAWEVLVVLRPDVPVYRERLADIQRQIDSAVAEKMPRAASAAQAGDIDSAARQYLAILALQPHNALAADALRALERERNKRNHLGRHSRSTITRRAAVEAEIAAPLTAVAPSGFDSAPINVNVNTNANIGTRPMR